MKSEILDISNAVSGSANPKPRPNMSRSSNKVNIIDISSDLKCINFEYLYKIMEDMTISLVNKIKSSMKCQVVQLEVEFLHDIQGLIWMTRACNCVITSEKLIPRYNSITVYLVILMI